MGRALEVRKRLVDLHGDGAKPTVSDLLTKVCAMALMRHRAVNALYKGDAIELHPTANVGIAVAIPNGLVVPVIQGCERKTIAEIAAARADLVERARGGKLQQQDLDGGTFTISNLGMFGIERFIAVLNPPQAAILAVGSTEEKPVVVDGEVVVRSRLELTLTCDHRAIDGATGAQFLGDVKAFLEEPGLALVTLVWYQVRDLDAARALLQGQARLHRDVRRRRRHLGQARAERHGDRPRRG